MITFTIDRKEEQKNYEKLISDEDINENLEKIVGKDIYEELLSLGEEEKENKLLEMRNSHNYRLFFCNNIHEKLLKIQNELKAQNENIKNNFNNIKNENLDDKKQENKCNETLIITQNITSLKLIQSSKSNIINEIVNEKEKIIPLNENNNNNENNENFKKIEKISEVKNENEKINCNMDVKKTQLQEHENKTNLLLKNALDIQNQIKSSENKIENNLNESLNKINLIINELNEIKEQICILKDNTKKTIDIKINQTDKTNQIDEVSKTKEINQIEKTNNNEKNENLKKIDEILEVKNKSEEIYCDYENLDHYKSLKTNTSNIICDFSRFGVEINENKFIYNEENVSEKTKEKLNFIFKKNNFTTNQIELLTTNNPNKINILNKINQQIGSSIKELKQYKFNDDEINELYNLTNKKQDERNNWIRTKIQEKSFLYFCDKINKSKKMFNYDQYITLKELYKEKPKINEKIYNSLLESMKSIKELVETPKNINNKNNTYNEHYENLLKLDFYLRVINWHNDELNKINKKESKTKKIKELTTKELKEFIGDNVIGIKKISEISQKIIINTLENDAFTEEQINFLKKINSEQIETEETIRNLIATSMNKCETTQKEISKTKKNFCKEMDIEKNLITDEEIEDIVNDTIQRSDITKSFFEKILSNKPYNCTKEQIEFLNENSIDDIKQLSKTMTIVEILKKYGFSDKQIDLLFIYHNQAPIQNSTSILNILMKYLYPSQKNQEQSNKFKISTQKNIYDFEINEKNTNEDSDFIVLEKETKEKKDIIYTVNIATKENANELGFYIKYNKIILKTEQFETLKSKDFDDEIIIPLDFTCKYILNENGFTLENIYYMENTFNTNIKLTENKSIEISAPSESIKKLKIIINAYNNTIEINNFNEFNENSSFIIYNSLESTINKLEGKKISNKDNTDEFKIINNVTNELEKRYNFYWEKFSNKRKLTDDIIIYNDENKDMLEKTEDNIKLIDKKIEETSMKILIENNKNNTEKNSCFNNITSFFASKIYENNYTKLLKLKSELTNELKENQLLLTTIPTRIKATELLLNFIKDKDKVTTDDITEEIDKELKNGALKGFIKRTEEEIGKKFPQPHSPTNLNKST